MAEVIREDLPRVKYTSTRVGDCAPPYESAELAALGALMARLEAAGAAPVLEDGAVGGNCGILLDVPGETEPALFVSRTGKPSGVVLSSSDFVRVLSFDDVAWAAAYAAAPGSDARPTSDVPLLAACLMPGAAARRGWAARPRIALHGHALAQGDGLAVARGLGLPVSEGETLFSTPEDLAALEVLLESHPYPGTTVYIRRGHGFFLLAGSVEEAAMRFEQLIVPHM